MYHLSHDYYIIYHTLLIILFKTVTNRRDKHFKYLLVYIVFQSFLSIAFPDFNVCLRESCKKTGNDFEVKTHSFERVFFLLMTSAETKVSFWCICFNFTCCYYFLYFFFIFFLLQAYMKWHTEEIFQRYILLIIHKTDSITNIC